MPGSDIADTVLSRIRDVPDYPTPGILFKDITPLLADPVVFAAVVEALAAPFRDGSGPAGPGGATTGDLPEGPAGRVAGVDVVVGIEARGFILGAPVAVALGVGFVPVRKRGKLPHRTVGAAYALEYGTAEIEIHADAIRPGQRVAVIDDVLATGGTASATCDLVERVGGQVLGLGVLLELGFLDGRSRLAGRDIRSLATV
ncbi:MAG: adenine phosphoribosyltransferase [Kineosporiaceae bacterium]|jgi:adenine phosphoribosyltransferase